ncbi:MAG: DedA family protein [Eubacteriales bacterium]
MEQTLNEILQILASQNLFAVCAIIFVCAVLQFVFPPMPSDMLLVALGILAATETFSGWLTCPTYALGAVAGSFALYAICFHFGDKVLSWRIIKSMTTDEGLAKAKEKICRFGGPAMMLMRFIPSLQVIAVISFGLTHYPRRKMLLWLSLSSAFSSAVFFLIGYLLGGNIPELLKLLSALGEAGWVLLGAVIVVAVICIVIFAVRRKRRGKQE